MENTKQEAQELKDQIYSDVIGLGITRVRQERWKIVKLVAEHLQKACPEKPYHLVISDCNEIIDEG